MSVALGTWPMRFTVPLSFICCEASVPMSSIVILAASFITALIGIIRNNRAKPGEKSLFGLNLLGAVLLGLSITGATAALVQEVRSLRAKAEDSRTINDLAQKLDRSIITDKEVAQKLDKLADTVKDPNVKQAVMDVRSRLSSMEFDEVIPPWVPIYPGVQPENVQARRDQSGWSGKYFVNHLPGYPILAWYHDTLRNNDEFTTTTDNVRVKRASRLESRDISGRRRIMVIQHFRRAEVLWEERDK